MGWVYEPKRVQSFYFDVSNLQIYFGFTKKQNWWLWKSQNENELEAEERERWGERSILIGSETHVPPNSSVLLANLFYPCDVC